MKIGEMLGYTNRLKEIAKSNTSEHIKDQRLANLMTDLESTYDIPLFGKERREQFEKANPHLMQLYRTVSEERTI